MAKPTLKILLASWNFDILRKSCETYLAAKMFARVITLVIMVLIPHPTYGEKKRLAHFKQLENVIFSLRTCPAGSGSHFFSSPRLKVQISIFCPWLSFKMFSIFKLVLFGLNKYKLVKNCQNLSNLSKFVKTCSKRSKIVQACLK